MIKIRISGHSNEIEFEDNYINILEIQNKKYFKQIIEDINKSILENERNNKILLFENDEVKDFNKNILMFIDIFNIDFNDKKILTQLYQRICDNIKLEENLETKYKELVESLKKYIREKVNELPFEYTIKEEIKAEDILKLFSVKLDTEYYIDLIEKVFFLFDLVSTFKLAKVLILVNAKLYFENDELEEIYKYAKYTGINLLLIEKGFNEEPLKYEKKLYIDEEYDDFIIKSCYNKDK